MAANDWFSPYFRVTLVKRDGFRMPLWFSPVLPPDAAAAFQYADASNVGGISTNLAIVSGVEIEQSLGNFFVITVNCSPTFEDAMALFESDAIVTGDTQIEVQYGYQGTEGGLLTRVFVGLLTDPDFSIGEEITVTLKAQATCSAGMLDAGTTEVLNGTRRELIVRTAEGFGEPKRLVRVNFDGVTGTTELALLDETVSITPTGKNDNLFMRDLVEQCMCEVYYRPDDDDPTLPVMVVIDRERRFGADAHKEFVLYRAGTRLGGDALVSGVYPILGVSTQSKQVFIRGVVQGTIRPNVSDTRENAPAPELTYAADNSGPVMAPGESPGGQGQVRPPATSATPGAGPNASGGTSSQLGTDEYATQRASNQEQQFKEFIDSGVQLSIDTIGVPDLEPGAIVVVDGLGKRFNGKYSLLKVVHSFNDSGYTTKWDGINNAGFLYARDEALATTNRTLVLSPDENTLLREPSVQGGGSLAKRRSEIDAVDRLFDFERFLR